MNKSFDNYNTASISQRLWVNSIKLIFLASGFLLLFGCATGSKYVPPPPMPTNESGYKEIEYRKIISPLTADQVRDSWIKTKITYYGMAQGVLDAYDCTAEQMRTYWEFCSKINWKLFNAGTLSPTDDPHYSINNVISMSNKSMLADLKKGQQYEVKGFLRTKDTIIPATGEKGLAQMLEVFDIK